VDPVERSSVPPAVVHVRPLPVGQGFYRVDLFEVSYTYIVKEQKQSSLGLRNHRPPSRGPAKNLPGLLQNPKALTAPV